MMGVFLKDFEPVVKVGQILQIGEPTKAGAKVSNMAQVLFIEPVPVITKDFGSLATVTSSSVTEMDTELEVEANQILQLRIIPCDDVEITVKQPRGVGKFTTRYTTTSLKLLPEGEAFQRFQESEMFIKEDDVIYLEVKNPTKYTQARNKVAFLGYKYLLRYLSPAEARKITIYTWIPTFGSGKYSS